MNRGRRTEAIFADKKDYQCFMDLLKETSEMWEIKIAAYCLMPNHYHLLVQPPMPINEPRNVAVYLARKLRRDTLTRICKDFSINKYSSVSSIIGRMEKRLTRLTEDKKLRKNIELLRLIPGTVYIFLDI